MKKKLFILLVLLLSIVNSVSTIDAAVLNYDEYAQSLSKLGVFVGTNNGFELDRAPTRIEGIIMLIRLLGAEDDANSMKNNKVPFTDVPTWANGYVSYAYEKGLTKGVTETKFGSANTLEAKAYITFLLRSLGYNDVAGDFSYNNSISYSREINLINESMQSILNNSTLVRGHVAKLSYDTLWFQYKGSDTLLIDKLIAEEDINIELGNKFKENLINDNNIITSTEIKPIDISENSDCIVMLQCNNGNNVSQGSGIIINSDGEILTNYHVIEGSTSIDINFNDRTKYIGDVYIQDYDKDLDLAVIKINKSKLKAVSIGNSDNIKLGESVVAIGSPYGFFNTVTEGIISALRPNSIQISAAISHGSSGGGLFNYKGELIGVTSAGVTVAENLGFAIPINFLSKLSDKKLTPINKFGLDTAQSTSIVYPPTNIRIVNETIDEVYINWNEVPDADYYHFYYQKDGEDTYWYDEESGSKMKYYYDSNYSIVFYGLESGTRYNIIVTSVKNGIESADSTVFTFTKKVCNR